MPTRTVSQGQLDPAQAQALLLDCCASHKWARTLAASWPFVSFDQLSAAAEQAFDQLGRADWLEAFSSHAQIGRLRPGDERGAAEQSAVRLASEPERDELERLNLEYDRHFGHIFLICASGLSTEQMLSALRERLANPPELEFQIATREQRTITHLRLRATFAA